MKTIYQLICAICVICGICACEDFLDTDNLTMKDTSNFPINETDATQMVNGIYSVMNRNLADPLCLISPPTTVWAVVARVTSVPRASTV